MIIEEEDFRLIPVTEDSPTFDLELLYTIKPKGKETRKEFKIAAYGITIETALKRIVNFRINNKNKDKAISIKEYINQLKEEFNSIKTLLK